LLQAGILLKQEKQQTRILQVLHLILAQQLQLSIQQHLVLQEVQQQHLAPVDQRRKLEVHLGLQLQLIRQLLQRQGIQLSLEVQQLFIIQRQHMKLVSLLQLVELQPFQLQGLQQQHFQLVKIQLKVGIQQQLMLLLQLLIPVRQQQQHIQLLSQRVEQQLIIHQLSQVSLLQPRLELVKVQQPLIIQQQNIQLRLARVE
jgi:hypothetical protein